MLSSYRVGERSYETLLYNGTEHARCINKQFPNVKNLVLYFIFSCRLSMTLASCEILLFKWETTTHAVIARLSIRPYWNCCCCSPENIFISIWVNSCKNMLGIDTVLGNKTIFILFLSWKCNICATTNGNLTHMHITVKMANNRENLRMHYVLVSAGNGLIFDITMSHSVIFLFRHQSRYYIF